MAKHLGKVANPVLKHNDHTLESPFGERIYKGKKEQHNGVDLQYRTPTTKLKDNKPDTIIAIGDGIVTKVSYSSSRGYYAEVKHSVNVISRYLHMVKGSILVKVGQRITKGTPIGTTGMSGAADGVHLHLAIVVNGKYTDPLPYLLGEKDVIPKFEKGKVYKFTKEKFKRYGASVYDDKVPYKYLSDKDKKRCDNVGGYARTKIGAEYTLYDFVIDNKGNWWAITTSPTSKQPNKHYICVYDKTGYQAVMV